MARNPRFVHWKKTQWNARLYGEIVKQFKTIACFCETWKLSRTVVDDFIKLRMSPFSVITKSFCVEKKISLVGIYVAYAKRVAEALGMNVEELFPKALYEEKLLHNKKLSCDAEDCWKEVEGHKIEERNRMLWKQTETDFFLKEAICKAMDFLTEKERYVVSARFGLSGCGASTLKEVGAGMKVSRERVRQIECKAIRKMLSRPKFREHLMEYWKD